jgi:hypothetical protein
MTPAACKAPARELTVVRREPFAIGPDGFCPVSKFHNLAGRISWRSIASLVEVMGRKNPMKSESTSLRIVMSTFFIPLIGCFGISSFNDRNVTVAIQPEIKSIPVNSSQVFMTVTKNAPNVPLWSINRSYKSGLSTPGGTFVSTNAEPASATYTAPATPPIYTDAQVSAGNIQGSVILAAGVSIDQNAFDQTFATDTFAILGPLSVGISPSTVSVQVSHSQQFKAYVVGTLNTALTWQIQSVTGGGSSYGSISPTGLYTAPMAVPVTGVSVTVTAVSQADPTISASSVISLTSP